MTATDIEQIRLKLGDRYRIERELGRGGMGTVYLARDVRLDRQVALKVLPSEFVRNAALRERFLREMRTAASFSHPNIVPVHAVEESDDVVAFSMGFVEGESLGDQVRRSGPLGLRELVRLLQDVGYALAYAHGRGVVHRDIKPDNIMIERATGRALVMDFGIARTITPATTTPTTPGLTRVGEVVGTPEFMSPEQASAEPLDGRSDVYSLGLVAFFAATGRSVMEDSSPQRIMVRQLTEPVPPLSSERPDLPHALCRAIDRCVAKDVSQRFQSAEALVDAIDEAQLAVPEIPLQVRSLAQELSTLLLVLTLVTGISVFVVRDMPSVMPFYVRMLPATLFVAIGLGRIWQTLSEVRRLAELGYTLDDLMRGLRGVVDEQATVRDEARRNPRVRARRQRALRRAFVSIPLGMLAFYLAVAVVGRRPEPKGPPVMMVDSSGAALRPSGPPPDSGRQAGAPPGDSAGRRGNGGPPPNEKSAAALILVAFSLFGVSLVSLSRSPFRMSIGERVFRTVFLRTPGRAFLSIGVRAVDPAALPSVGRPVTPARTVAPPRTVTPSRVPALAPTVVPAPVTAMPSAPADAPTLSSLDARIAALEAWRDGK